MPAVGRVGRRELEELVTRVQHGGRCHLVHAVLVRPTRMRLTYIIRGTHTGEHSRLDPKTLPGQTGEPRVL